MHIILTVADHDQNGFVALARSPRMSEAEARAFIAAQDALVGDDAEPDLQTCSFSFVLDLMEENGDCIDNGKRSLPTQIAMMLAPNPVRQWLNERPYPDAVINRAVPLMALPA